MKKYRCSIDLKGSEKIAYGCKVLDKQFNEPLELEAENIYHAVSVFICRVEDQFGSMLSKVVGIKVYEVPQETQKST